jgi:hypothetical protein
MADRLGHQGRLGHQKVTKEYLAGPNVSVPRRMTGITKNGENSPKNLFNQSFSISF